MTRVRLGRFGKPGALGTGRKAIPWGVVTFSAAGMALALFLSGMGVAIVCTDTEWIEHARALPTADSPETLVRRCHLALEEKDFAAVWDLYTPEARQQALIAQLRDAHAFAKYNPWGEKALENALEPYDLRWTELEHPAEVVAGMSEATRREFFIEIMDRCGGRLDDLSGSVDYDESAEHAFSMDELRFHHADISGDSGAVYLQAEETSDTALIRKQIVRVDGRWVFAEP